MYIDHIWIENVKGFGEGQIDLSLDRGQGTYAGWTVFAGRNSAGKTTLLRAVALAVVGLRGADRLQESFVGWVHEGSTIARVKVGLVYSKRDTFASSGMKRPRFDAALTWTLSAAGKEPELSKEEHVAGRKSMAERGPWSEATSGWFLAGYGPFRRLSGQTVEAQRLMGRSMQAARLGTLFRDDASLLGSLEWLRDLRIRQADNDAEADNLMRATFALINDGLLPGDVKALRYDAGGLWVKTPKSASLPVQDLSDGYRAVIALVLDLVRAIDSTYGGIQFEDVRVLDEGVALIDEVDAHLHVSWQQRIGVWLKKHFPKIQFLVTSHSAFVCQAADRNGLVILPTPGTDEQAKIADEDLYLRAVNGPADDALLSNLFGMDHTWSDASALKREEMAEIEGRILREEATDADGERYQVLRGEVPRDPSETADVDRALRRRAMVVLAGAK